MNGKFALCFLELVHHFTELPHLKLLTQLNRTSQNRDTDYSAFLPSPCCSFLIGLSDSLGTSGWAWRNLTRSATDRKWGDQARGCWEDLGKDVGGLNSAITYEGWTGTIRMSVRSQKWEFATVGGKRTGQHEERVPGVGLGNTSWTEKKPRVHLDHPLISQKGLHHHDEHTALEVSYLCPKSQPSLYFNCLLRKFQHVEK